MLLSGINITSPDLLHDKFSYSDILKSIDQSAMIYLDMLDKYFRPIRLIDNRVSNNLKLLLDDALPSRIVAVDWVDENGYVQEKLLRARIGALCVQYQGDTTRVSLPIKAGTFCDCAVDAIRKITKDYKRRLPSAAVLELELMICIHLQAARLIDEKACELVAARVDALCFDDELPDMTAGDEIIIPASCSDLSLPLYRGGSGNLSIVRIVSLSDKPVTVRLGGSTLQRTLYADHAAFAVKKGGAIVDFLPSFTMQGDVKYEAEHEGLMLSRDGKKKSVPLGYEPAAWASSREFGTLLIDRKGKMDRRHALGRVCIDGSAACVAADGSHYCVLREDGSVHSNFEKSGWENIIAMSICRQRAAAITDERKAVLEDGEVIGSADAVRALVCGSRHLWLDCEGSVHTDDAFPGGKLPLPGPAAAIALSEDRCAAAVSNAIVIFTPDGTQCGHISVQGTADEIVLQGHTLYYREPDTGIVAKADV